MMNHAQAPFMFKLENKDLKECYELTSLNQFINLPIDPDTDDVLDAQDALGACLGFQVLRTKMEGAPSVVNMTLIEDEGDESLPFPQTLIFYSLDGKLKQYQIFVRDWRKVDLLKGTQKPSI